MSGIRAPEPLPPFSGLNASCRKCGDAAAKVTWHLTNSADNFPCKYTRGTGEHMCQMCPCGYGWMEAPKDAPATGEDQ